MTRVPDRKPRELLLAVAGFAALSVACTWPLVTRFATRIGGDRGDAWGNLWNVWWVRRAVLSGSSPFETDLLHYPNGAPLWFHTLDLPNAAIGFFLWPLMPPLAVHNTLMLLTFALSGLGMYLLLREVGARPIGAALGGVAWTMTPFHFAHALGHLGLCSLQWLVLWLWLWARSEREDAKWSGALAGLMLACAAHASWYFAVFAALVAPFWFPARWKPASEHRRRWLVRTAHMVLVAGALVLPLAVKLMIERASGTWEGQHDASFYSADLLGFFLPGASSAFASAASKRWTGNAAETATYLGYVVVALAVVGAWRQRWLRVLLIAGVIGIALSFGPVLHVNGTKTTTPMPYGWLEDVVPVLGFMGVPVRFSLVGSLVLALAAGLGASWLAGLRNGRVIVSVLGVLVAVEYLPHQFTTSSFPTATNAFARMKTKEGAVLDLTGHSHAFWNQMHHERPMVGGNISRWPKQLEEWIQSHPVIGPLYARPRLVRRVEDRKVTAIDFEWRRAGPIRGADGDHWQATFRMGLDVDVPGEWAFAVESDDGAVLRVDGRVVVDNGGVHSPVRKEGSVALDEGRHELEIAYREVTRGAMLKGWVRPPGGEWRVLQGDIDARYTVRVNSIEPGREAAIAMLRRAGVRWIIHPDWKPNRVLEQELRLPVFAKEATLTIYEVPPEPPPRREEAPRR